MSIYEQPQEIYVVAYAWQTGGASGGVRKCFLSKREAELELEGALGKGTINQNRPIAVFKLVSGEWTDLRIAMPEKLRVIDDEE